MSEVQKATAKARWELCGRLAAMLGCGKTHVHDKLYSKLKERELVDAVLAGEQGAVAAVKAWPEFYDEGVKLWMPKKQTPTAMEKLKIAQWFVDKMGGMEQAKKALFALERLDQELSEGR